MDRFDIALPLWQEGVDDVLARLRAAGN
ncbi:MULTISPECIES: hypothetical protein [unclassified Rhizobium]|nr:MULTISPECIES: hypothetical protein [unclassified Rhizobium]